MLAMATFGINIPYINKRIANTTWKHEYNKSAPSIFKPNGLRCKDPISQVEKVATAFAKQTKITILSKQLHDRINIPPPFLNKAK